MRELSDKSVTIEGHSDFSFLNCLSTGLPFTARDHFYIFRTNIAPQHLGLIWCWSSPHTAYLGSFKSRILQGKLLGLFCFSICHQAPGLFFNQKHSWITKLGYCIVRSFKLNVMINHFNGLLSKDIHVTLKFYASVTTGQSQQLLRLKLCHLSHFFSLRLCACLAWAHERSTSPNIQLSWPGSNRRVLTFRDPYLIDQKTYLSNLALENPNATLPTSSSKSSNTAEEAEVTRFSCFLIEYWDNSSFSKLFYFAFYTSPILLLTWNNSLVCFPIDFI